MQTLGADELMRRLKDAATETWRGAKEATGGRPLAIATPEGAPPKLVEALDKHNASAAELDARLVELEGAADAVVALVDAEDGTADRIGEAVERFRGWRLRMLVDYRRLLLARAPLLEQAAEALGGPLADAERELAKTKDDSRAKLLAAGFIPPPGRGQPGVNSEAERRALESQVDRLAPVRAAADRAANIRGRLNELSAQAATVERDADQLAMMIASEIDRRVKSVF